MRHYATVAHQGQISVLLASMRRYCAPFVLHALAWDYHPPADADDLRFTLGPWFLRRHPELEPDRLPGPPRSAVDAVCTVRWAFFANVLEQTGEPLTALDGDLFFFSSPEPMFAEIPASAPFAVTPHRIPPASAGLPGVTFETHRDYGLYNGGLSVWRERGPLLEMAEATRKWSYTEVRSHPVDGLPDFGDQGAIERLTARHGAHIIAHPGVNLAPWNIHGAHLRDFMPAGGPPLPATYPVVGHPPQPLIAYHFSSLRLAANGTVAQLADPCYEITPWQARLLYEPYLEAIRHA